MHRCIARRALCIRTASERVYIAGGGTSLDKKRKRYSRGEICCAREGMGVSRRVEGEGDGERERESAESPPRRPHHRVSPPGHEARERGEPSVNRLASRACTYIADPFAFRREGSTKGVKTIHRLFLRFIPSHSRSSILSFFRSRSNVRYLQ